MSEDTQPDGGSGGLFATTLNNAVSIVAGDRGCSSTFTCGCHRRFGLTDGKSFDEWKFCDGHSETDTPVSFWIQGEDDQP